jgi:DeoR/GlpR family transcriptional regulator of sugar metabolism
MALIQQERENLILELFRNQNVIRVEQLASELNVTQATIRTDLQRMTKKGLVRRVHGGAVLERSFTSHEAPFILRKDSFLKEKQQIGRVAAEEIVDGQTVVLDISTTVLEVAKNLKNRKNLIVITNSIHNVLELVDVEDIQLILLGGLVERVEKCMVGPIAIKTLSHFYADKVFIGIGGLSLEKGITDFGLAESEVRKLMIESGKEIIAVADSSKIDKISFVSTAPLYKINKLITDWHIRQDQREALREQGIGVVVCKPPE